MFYKICVDIVTFRAVLLLGCSQRNGASASDGVGEDTKGAADGRETAGVRAAEHHQVSHG